MKRFARRTVAILIGLVLGWYAAGLWESSKFPDRGAFAAEDHARSESTPHDPHASGGHGDVKEAVAQLQPKRDDMDWYNPVLYSVAGLFAAAVVLGIPALKLRGPLPPDPADVHDAHAAHDTHGHQDDSHGGHAHSHTPAETHPKAH